MAAQIDAGSDALNAVLDKVSAIFVCKHEENTKTAKSGRAGQKYLATNELNEDLALAIKDHDYVVTAKVDGTNVYVKDGRLLKRRDRKPHWKTGKMKEMPSSWILTGETGGRHEIGFMDLEKGDKWFFDVFESDGTGTDKIGHPLLAGTPSTKVRCIEMESGKLRYVYRELSDLNEKTFELVGPKLQNNPHRFDKHCLIEHGLLRLSSFPRIESGCLENIKNWMQDDQIGKSIEGVVLHLSNGQLYKIHRHHLDMEWKAESGLMELQF